LPIIKVMTILGTRPEAIKLAPVIQKLQSAPERFACKIVATAQHRSMLDQMLEVFSLKPDVDLDIMEENQSLFQLTQKTIQRLETVLREHQPDVVMVQGDTTSTFLGALAAFYFRIKVAHVEAGLRSRQKYSPFPEEINRRLTSVVTDIHFPPTSQARENLLREGVSAQQIFVTGNTAVDAVLSIMNEDHQFTDPMLHDLLSNHRRYVVVTAHRRENWGESFENVANAILQLVTRYRDLHFVFPIHKNPQVRKTFQARLNNHARVHLIEPLDYRSFIHLAAHSLFILTDSGGIQEEAPSLRKPALVMREVTERPEGLSSGFLKLVGCNADRIVAEAGRLIDDRKYYATVTQGQNPYGDGRAAQRIVDALLFSSGIRENRPEDFFFTT
jgi:UDP-N-acetylglucosamine 2-epimerase (non-hydrolysing)